MLFKRAPKSTPARPEADAPRGGLMQRLGKSRNALARGLGALLGGTTDLDDSIFEELEEFLISADVGVAASRKIVASVEQAARSRRLPDAAAVLDIVRQEMLNILTPCAKAADYSGSPHVIMMVGVNGVGKTTTIAKLAKRLKDEHRKVMLAAGDTFRAAAVEQLQTWGERLDLPVVHQGQGSDAAAVAHDALQAAPARGVDVLIVDTAGRQHTQADLMEQLKKIKRVIQKLEPAAPHQVIQVLDAGTGQNALSQLEHFHAAVGVTGLVVTKLDGTAKGGVLLAMAERFHLPILYLGVGEKFEDLRDFDAAEFVDALVPRQLGA